MHGIIVNEVTEGARSLATIATAVIGMVATATAPAGAATAALDAAFPLNKAVLVSDLEAAIAAAGTGGTLSGALRAIADQTRTPTVVVRVAAGANAEATDAAVIGGTVDGKKTGMQALLAAEAQLGYKPRIIGTPGLESLAVTTALTLVAKKLRARAYAAAIGADRAALQDYRENFVARELMLLNPDFLAFDQKAAATVISHAVGRALGMRAKTDQIHGWHKTLSNLPVGGVTGTTRDIEFDIQDPTCEANLLNDMQITTLVRFGGGYRFWGNRTCAGVNEQEFAFESAVATAQVLMDTIAEGMAWAIDKPMRPSLVKDIVETINRKGAQLQVEGRILGFRAWYDPTKNSVDQLKQGILSIDYEYTPVPPLEALTLTQRITDTYLAGFGADLSGIRA